MTEAATGTPARQGDVPGSVASGAAVIGFAVITGASSGIGAAVARRLAGERRRLVLIGRDATRLDRVADDCRALGADCRTGLVDVTDRAALSAFLQRLEAEATIDLFVACAGILEGRVEGAVTETSEVAHRVLDANLMATIDAVHMCLPAMRARRRGTILLVASLAAFAPLADAPAYSASKAGLLSYGLALREAISGEGVNVCVVCPGYVTSPMTARHMGPRPGEISAEAAAEHIIAAMKSDRDLTGFPGPLYWLARISLFFPERLRRFGTERFRFHVS